MPAQSLSHTGSAGVPPASGSLAAPLQYTYAPRAATDLYGRAACPISVAVTLVVTLGLPASPPAPPTRRARRYRVGRPGDDHPPRLSSVSSMGRRMQVNIGVSRSVYRLPSTPRSSMTRSRKSDGLSVSNPTTNSWSSSPNE